jgi:CubicO group peptidase (beta-lactamase class C family)
MTDENDGLPWPSAEPRDAGFDPDRLARAVDFAQAHESRWPRSMYVENGTFIGSAYVEDKPPYDRPLGPVKPRGGANGLVLRGGRLVASWGDTRRADMTFSIAKSYLALLTGLAVDRHLVRSVDDRVADYVTDDGFTSGQNAPITWRHLLEQTSEWQGTLFDRPDSVDSNRQAGPQADNRQKGSGRALQPPGRHWEYNDVRVNRLALSLLQVFKEALPSVLKREIMGPIGASDGWAWEGYENSWVEIDGARIQSVPGGGHWGGGLFIDARDHAHIGQLVLRHGEGSGGRILSKEWIDAMLRPSQANPVYGFLWWLNTDAKLYPSAPDSSVFALGGGQHSIWVDHPRDLVVVTRWIDKPNVDALFGKIMDALVE